MRHGRLALNQQVRLESNWDTKQCIKWYQDKLSLSQKDICYANGEFPPSSFYKVSQNQLEVESFPTPQNHSDKSLQCFHPYDLIQLCLVLLFLISYFKFLHEGFSTRPTTQLKAINFQKNFFLYKDTCHIVKSANIIPSPLLALTNLSSKKAAKKGPLSALQSLHNITKSYISHKQMIVPILLSLKFLKNQKGKNEKT